LPKKIGWALSIQLIAQKDRWGIEHTTCSTNHVLQICPKNAEIRYLLAMLGFLNIEIFKLLFGRKEAYSNENRFADSE